MWTAGRNVEVIVAYRGVGSHPQLGGGGLSVLVCEKNS